ncbi:MAG: hypothetical protein KF729_27330 [Sandaracinaceae bacterium]|nr:hypothetical protein [Sandaracinaceae bacterium]
MSNWFIGWPLEAAALDAILAAPPRGVRVLAPEDRHVTLAFLGPVGEARAGAAFDALDVASLRPLEVTLGGVVLMGHPRRGTALAAELERGRDGTEAAIGALREAPIAAAGARAEARPPYAHATLARIAQRASPTERRAALRWAAALPTRGLGATLAAIALFGPAEHPGPARYRAVRVTALAPAPS